MGDHVDELIGDVDIALLEASATTAPRPPTPATNGGLSRIAGFTQRLCPKRSSSLWRELADGICQSRSFQFV